MNNNLHTDPRDDNAENAYNQNEDLFQSYTLFYVFEQIIIAYQQGKSFGPVINDYIDSGATSGIEDIVDKFKDTLGIKTETAPEPEMWRYEHSDYTQAVKQTLQLFAMRYKVIPFSPQEIDLDLDGIIDICTQERAALLPDLRNSQTDWRIFTPKGERIQMAIAESFFVRAAKCLIYKDYFEDTLKEVDQLLRFGPLPKNPQNPSKEIHSLLKKIKNVMGDDGDFTIHISKC